MSEWAPIYRGDDFDFDFWLEDEAGDKVPLSEVTAELGELALTVTPLGGNVFNVSLPAEATEPDPDTNDLTGDNATLCVHVTYTDGRRRTAIRETLSVASC